MSNDGNREVKTIQINGKTFVAGLFWQPISQNVKALGAELGMQLMIVRHTSLPQAGFVSKNVLNVKAGDYSLAAVVTKALELEQVGSNWIAVIPIPDTEEYYYIVMTEDVVRPSGEFIGTLDEVQEQFREDRTLADWNLMILPKEFNAPGAEERDLLSFFPQSGGKIKFHHWWRLTNVQNVSNHQVKIILSVLMFSLITGGGGYYLYEKNKKEKEIERYRLQQLALKAQASSISMIKPWATVPSAIAVMSHCFETMNKYSMLFNTPDLKIQKVTCLPSTITFKGERLTSSDIQLDGKDLVFTSNGSIFEYKEALHTMNSTKEEDSLSKNSVIQYLTKIGSVHHFKTLAITESVSAPIIGQTAVASGSMQKVDFAFEHSKAEDEINELPLDFMNIPTMRIKKAEYTARDNDYYWHIEGEIYVK